MLSQIPNKAPALRARELGLEAINKELQQGLRDPALADPGGQGRAQGRQDLQAKARGFAASAASVDVDVAALRRVSTAASRGRGGHRGGLQGLKGRWLRSAAHLQPPPPELPAAGAAAAAEVAAAVRPAVQPQVRRQVHRGDPPEPPAEILTIVDEYEGGSAL